jgi:hypothetical protein
MLLSTSTNLFEIAHEHELNQQRRQIFELQEELRQFGDYNPNGMQKIIDQFSDYNFVASCPRRAGKTFWGLKEACRYAVNNQNSIVILIDRPQAVPLDAVRTFLSVHQIKSTTRTPMRIGLENDSTIHVVTDMYSPRGGGANTLLGMSADRIIVSEAMGVDNSSWLALIPIMIGDHSRNVKTSILFTPSSNNDENLDIRKYFWNAQEFMQVRVPATCVVSNAVLADMKLQLSADQFATEWMAQLPTR